MAIELKRNEQQVRVDTKPIGGQLDSRLAKAASLDSIIPSMLVAELGEYAGEYAEKKMQSIDSASQADYNSRVLNLQSEIAQEVTDNTGKVPFNEMYSTIVEPRLQTFQSILPTLGYSKPMTEKVINDFTQTKSKIQYNEIIQIENLERKNIQKGIENGMLDWLSSHKYVKDIDSIVISPLQVTDEEVDNKISIKKSNAMPSRTQMIMSTVEGKKEYDRSKIKKEIEAERLSEANKLTEEERNKQRGLNAQFDKYKEDLENVMGEIPAGLWIEEQQVKRINTQLKAIKDSGDAYNFQTKINLIETTIKENTDLLSPDVIEDIKIQAQSLQVELLNQESKKITADLTQLNQLLLADEYTKYNAKVNELADKYDNPLLKKELLNRINKQMQTEVIAIEKTEKGKRTKSEKEILDAFNYLSLMRTGYDIIKDKQKSNVNLTKTLENVSKLDPVARDFFYNALPTALQGMIDDGQSESVYAFTIGDFSNILGYSSAPPKVTIQKTFAFDEQGRDFLNEAYYYARYNKNPAEMLRQSVLDFIKLKRDTEGNPSLEEYSKFKKKHFGQSIDEIIGNPFITENVNMFTASEKEFTNEEIKTIVNAME